MLKDFLKRSPLSHMIKLNTEIILCRSSINSEEFESNLADQEMSLQLPTGRTHELEVNGQTIAMGKIVKKWGRPYFKVTKIKKI